MGLTWYVVDGSGNVSSSLPSEQLTVGQWYHVAATCKFGSAQDVKCYLNGDILQGNWSMGNGMAQTTINTKPLTIGGLTDNKEMISGVIDDVRLYNTALSAEKINQLYLAGLL